jgi:hypothetical protein
LGIFWREVSLQTSKVRGIRGYFVGSVNGTILAVEVRIDGQPRQKKNLDEDRIAEMRIQNASWRNMFQFSFLSKQYPLSSIQD